MPQKSVRSVGYRSCLTCDDPRGVIEGKTIRISKTHSPKMETPRIEIKTHKSSILKEQSEAMAEDMLKGALDLQVSLMKLGKLQEASHYKPKLNKSQKEKSNEEVFGGKIGSDRSYEDIASTSSSRSSSMAYSSHEFTSSDSFSTRAIDEKSKRSNLIAKLMGLEEFPLKALSQNQLDNSRIKDQKRAVFDIDLSKSRRPQFFVRKMDQEQMTMDKIIDSKEHLRSNKHEIKKTPISCEKIVIMKPQRLGLDKKFVCREKSMENQKVKADVNPIRKINQEKVKIEDKEVKISRAKLPSNKQKSQKKNKMEKKSAFSNPILKLKSSSNLPTTKSNNQKKKLKIEKPICKSLKTIVKNIRREEEVLQIDLACENQSHSTRTEAKNAVMEEINIGRFQSVNEATISTTKSGNKEAFEECNNSISDAMTEDYKSESRNNHVENCAFDISEHKARILKTLSSFQDSEQGNSKLLLDCVNELLWSSTRWKDGCTLDEVVFDLEKMVWSMLFDDLVLELVT